jgi:hypothetical protein
MVTGAVEGMVLVPDVVRSIMTAARELLDMGATRLVIPGNFPLGCVPGYMSAANEKDQATYDANGCLVGLNLFAQIHNVLLQEQTRELRASYPTETIAYADYFYAYVQMLKDAGKTEGSVTKACCGAGGGTYNVDMDPMCGAPGHDGVREAGGAPQLGRRAPDAARVSRHDRLALPQELRVPCTSEVPACVKKTIQHSLLVGF